MYVIADSQSEQPAEPAFGMSAPFKMAKLGSISGTRFDFAFKKSKTNKGNMPTVSEPDNNTELLEEERQNEDTTSSNKENMPTDMELLEEERRTDSTSKQ